MNNKILITDLDDTLLTDKLDIGKEDKQSILDFESKGGITVLCSGRPTASILKSASKIFSDNRKRYIISFNGAEIIETINNHPLYQEGLTITVAKQLCSIAHQAGITAQIYHNNQFYVEKKTPEAIKYSKATSLNWDAVGLLDEFITFSPLKVLFHAAHEKLESIIPQIQKISEGNFHFTYSKPHYLEFINPDINKGVAVKRLCEKLNIERSRVVAVGDSDNDMEMLKAAGTSAAVANAKQSVKDISSYICKRTNNENPITEVLNQFFN